VLHALVALIVLGGAGSPQPPEASAESPQARYELEFVGIDAYGTSTGHELFAPYQGKFKRPLEGAEFYDVIDQPALAASYRGKETTKLALEIASPVAIILGAVYAFASFKGCSDYDGGCRQTAILVGASAVGAGMLAGFIGRNIDPDPISGYEARKLIDSYNRKLRRRLQLKEQPTRSNGVRVAIAPRPGGVEAGVLWTF
jgi:hypothetical protein